MPAMKLTPNAAMRARDVSRPRPEHLDDAEAAEARMGGGLRGRAGDAGIGSGGIGSTGRPEPDEAQAGGATGDDRDGITRVGGDDRGGRAGFPRRRRGRLSR